MENKSEPGKIQFHGVRLILMKEIIGSISSRGICEILLNEGGQNKYNNNSKINVPKDGYKS